MQHESQGQNLHGELHGEDDEEVVFCGLQLHGQQRLVPVGKVLLHGHHHAGGDDGDQDRVLERSASGVKEISARFGKLGTMMMMTLA